MQSCRCSPYGSAGTYATNYGFAPNMLGQAGEMTDATTGLVNLRARWYSPAQGRFVSKDTWQGDYDNPITLAKWLYANANPVKYTDPSGLCFIGSKWYFKRPIFGQCSLQVNETLPPPQVFTATSTPTPISVTTIIQSPTATSTPLVPDIVNFDPTLQPNGIIFNPIMSIPLSPSVPSGVAYAQYYPKNIKLGPSRPSISYNLCGLIDLTMIANAGDILDRLWTNGLQSSTDPYDSFTLLSAAVKSMPGNWQGTAYSWNWKAIASTDNTNLEYSENIWPGEDVATALKTKMINNHYLLLLVQSSISSTGYDHVISNLGIGHWVVLTGFSSVWRKPDDSPWNWVSINNPFNNRREYYPWAIFKSSFSHYGYQTVELWKGE